MKSLIAILLLILMLTLAGCECIGGLGRDIQYAGHWLEDTSERVRK
nr:entericidin EcnA/B family protein [uncultured Desulfuromonas sp.]